MKSLWHVTWRQALRCRGTTPSSMASACQGPARPGRRIDFALGCGHFHPVAMEQRWVGSDHVLVAYTVETETAFRAPRFRPLTDSPVTEAQWASLWHEELFQEAIGGGDVNRTWTLLSDAAEDAGDWAEEVFVVDVHERCKAARTSESLLGVQLRRLQRRVAQLQRFPEDCRLRDKAAKQALELEAKAPWLRELPCFGMEAWAGWLQEHIEDFEKAEKAIATARWRQRLDGSEPQTVSWIRRREKLKLELARPAVAADAVLRVKATPYTACWQVVSSPSVCLVRGLVMVDVVLVIKAYNAKMKVQYLWQHN